jgi:hypothetical protein
MRYVGWLLVLLLLAPAAVAQNVPDEIPDVPDWSPDRVNRTRLTERHRPELARMFAATHVAVMPFGAFTTTDRLLQGGIRLDRGGAIHVTFGIRSMFDGLPFIAPIPDGVETSSYLFSLGYEVDGRVFGPEPFWQRATVGLGVGTLTTSASALLLEVNPRYMIYEGPYASIPVGLRASSVFASGSGQSVVKGWFLGPSIGFRLQLVRRDRLELR